MKNPRVRAGPCTLLARGPGSDAWPCTSLENVCLRMQILRPVRMIGSLQWRTKGCTKMVYNVRKKHFHLESSRPRITKSNQRPIMPQQGFQRCLHHGESFTLILFTFHTRVHFIITFSVLQNFSGVWSDCGACCLLRIGTCSVDRGCVCCKHNPAC